LGAALPQAPFLFSIAGLSVTLVGFSGLVAALRRDSPRTALDAYRLRQIPEMALAAALIALITLPLADVAGSATTAIRIASGLALVFTIAHTGVLYRRVRSRGIPLRGANWIIAGSIDTALVVVGA
jgi:hypothetical protein